MVQKLPSGETFARTSWLAASLSGVPAYELAWIPFGAFTSVSAPPFTSTGEAHLSNAQQIAHGFAECVGTLVGTGTGDTDMRSFAWHDGAATTGDLTISGSFVTLTNASGAAVGGGFRGFGLIQRIRPDTVGSFTVNPGNVEAVYLERLDHYHLIVSASSTEANADLEVYIYRIRHPFGGVATLVASHVIPNGVSNLKLGSPVRAEFTVQDVAGNPELSAKLLDYYMTPTQGVTVDLFDTSIIGGTVALGTSITNADGVLTDAHTDKIVGDGGAGFTLHRDRQDTVAAASVDVVEGIAAFEVRAAGSPSVLWRDEFYRVGTDGSQATGTNATKAATNVHGDTGTWLNSLWSFGATAATDNTQQDVEPNLIHSKVGATSYDPIDYVLLRQDASTPSDWGGLSRDFYSFRPSDYDYSHHRSFEFQPPPIGTANTGNIFRLGIALRGVAVAGYVGAALEGWLDWTVTSGASGVQNFLRFNVGLRIRTGSNDEPAMVSVATKTVQASGAAIPSGFDLYDGSWHKFEYDVHRFPEGTDPNSPVVHEVKFNGTAIVLDEPGTISTAQALPSGKVLDPTGAIQPGNVEAIEFYAQERETDSSSGVRWTPPLVRNWTQEALTLSSDGINPDSMVSASWADEGTATGSLETVFQPDYSMPLTSTWQRVSHSFDSGHAATRPVESRARRRWSLHRRGATTTEKDALLSFYHTHGIEVPFNWTPPNSSTSVTGRFGADTLLVEEFAKGAWAISFDVEEIFS